MPTNPLFNNFSNTLEQDILNSLVYESIRMYGQDMVYLPRRIIGKGMFGGDVDMAKYDSAYTVEMYVRSVEGFNGDTNFLTFQGLEIRDRVTFTVSMKAFTQEVLSSETAYTRPQEGDLIYFPLNKKCFQIKFVDDKPFFYQLGTLSMYDMSCELFEYSGELMETGITAIDSLMTNYTADELLFAVHDEAGNVLTDANGTIILYDAPAHASVWDPMDDSEEIETEAEPVIVFDEDDPFAEGIW